MSNENEKIAFRRRTMARVAAVQAIYQMDLTGDDCAKVILDADYAKKARFKYTRIPKDNAFFMELTKGIAENSSELEEILIGTLSSDWPIDRLDLVLRSILKAATYEFLYQADTPKAVIISEYVDIAHAFFEGSEPQFANGILEQIGSKLRENS